MPVLSFYGRSKTRVPLWNEAWYPNIRTSESHAVKGRKFAVSSFKKNLTFHMARAEVGGSDAEVDMLFGEQERA